MEQAVTREAMAQDVAAQAVRHLSLAELELALDEIRRSPADRGVLEMIVRRPTSGEREVLDIGELDVRAGLVGDRWSQSGADSATQITIMSARTIAVLAQSRDRWPLAGDQLYVDLDLSLANLPPGTRLAIGGAVLEVSAEPHTGCRKFRARYGLDAVRFVGSAVGKELNLRGINATVVQSGRINRGDLFRKL